MEYKVSLFADNQLLTLRKPLCSLPKLTQILEQFASLSKWKTNVTKSEVPFCNTPDQTPHLPYLGTTLTNTSQSLYKTNYGPKFQFTFHSNYKEDILSRNINH